MPPSARFPAQLQSAILRIYQSFGWGDEAFAHALIDASTNEGSVSIELISAWRSGAAHVSAMPVGALAVLLDHCGHGSPQAGRLLDAICRRYGFRATVEAEPADACPNLQTQLNGLVRDHGKAFDALLATIEDGCDPEEAAQAETALMVLEQRIAAARRALAAAPKVESIRGGRRTA